MLPKGINTKHFKSLGNIMAVKSAVKSSSLRKGSAFCSKVISAAKGAGFSSEELEKLEVIVTEGEERNEIISQAIATVLDLADIPPDDLEEILGILQSGLDNLGKKNEPFSQKSLKRLEELLESRISQKAMARIKKDLSKPNKELLEAIMRSLEKRKSKRKKLKYTPKKK